MSNDWASPDASDSGELSRYRLLLQVADTVIRAPSLPAALEQLAAPLLSMTGGDLLTLALHDPQRDCMVTQYWKPNAESGAFDALPVEHAANGWAWKHQEPVAITDTAREDRFPACVPILLRHRVRSYTVFPLGTPSIRLGALGVGRSVPEALSQEEMKSLSTVAELAALAMEKERTRRGFAEQQSLLAISRNVSLCLELEQLLPKILSSLRGIARYERSELSILDESGLQLCIYGEMPAGEPLRRPVSYPVAASLSAKTIETQSVVSYGAADLRDGDDSVGKALYDSGIRSVCSVPLLAGNRIWGALNLHSVKEKAFDPASVEYLQQVANQIGAALERARAADEIAQLKERLAPVRSRQKYESKAGRLNPNIVGTSLALQRVLEYAAIVADTDSTVLLTGETGTGKERIARLIHTMSRRKDRNFIKLNCAAIPTGLLESELFGHEKGAFTGAVSQKLGRLELADQGTLLLDEIGEIPLELQPKLLRVLQDQDFERLGGTKTIHVDVRLIAATNRDLARAVENKEFRGDLFYRLHVFPLHLPALRERREDIPELVRHYVEICSARLQKPMEAMPEEVLSVLMNWNWPGNIRELENFIERSVILSDGTWQNAPLRELRAGSVAETPDPDGSLRERERSHIIEILRQTRGALSGPGGAAARLGLKRTTLQYKMQRLGIARTDYLQ